MPDPSGVASFRFGRPSAELAPPSGRPYSDGRGIGGRSHGGVALVPPAPPTAPASGKSRSGEPSGVLPAYRMDRPRGVPARLGRPVFASPSLSNGTTPPLPRRRDVAPGRVDRHPPPPPAGGGRPRPDDGHRLRVRPPDADAPVHLRRHPHGPGRRAGDRVGDAGRGVFTKTRIVLQQWNKNFQTVVDAGGRSKIPDLFMVSSMGLHSGHVHGPDPRLPARSTRPTGPSSSPADRTRCISPIRVVRHRPGPDGTAGTDVAVTGEEYVLMNLLEVLLDMRADGESMRVGVLQGARDGGALDADSRHHVFARGPREGVAGRTGRTRVSNGYWVIWTSCPIRSWGTRLLEAAEPAGRRLGMTTVPGRRPNPQAQSDQFGRADLRLQIQLPVLPDPRLQPAAAPPQKPRPDRRGIDSAAEQKAYGLKYFFGADDNFFNHKQRTLDIVQTLADARSTASRSAEKSGGTPR